MHLITGAAGFIGSHLASALLARGERVVGIDNFDPFYARDLKEANLASLEGMTFETVDVREPAQVRDLFERYRPTTVYHLAARAGVRPSIEDPAGYARSNVHATSLILDEASRVGCARMLVASSSSVYGNNTKVPFAEDDPVDHPISPYAATKRSCELIAHAHAHLTGMPTACLRFFTVYGPRQRPDLAIRKFMTKIARGETITMFGDGTTSRDYTFVEDIVEGILAARDRIEGHRIWNLGGSSPITLRDMIDTIADVVGTPAKIEQVGMQPGDVDRTWADTTRLESELGFRPKVTFREGIERQWAWQREVIGS